MRNKVLITGVAGFAGRYLATYLADKGMQVFGTVHRESVNAIDGVSELYVADIVDQASIASVIQSVEPDYVIHLAAISFVGHDNISEIYETNIVGTRNLLSALDFIDKKPLSVIITSSANVYGNSTSGVLSETDDVRPMNDYAVSKVAMEYMANQFYSRLNIVMLRPFNYTGVGQPDNFLIPKIVKHFRDKASHIQLGNTDVSRDFSDVRLFVEYVWRVMNNSSTIGKTLNICTGVPTSLEDILQTCEKLTGHRISVIVNPEFVRSNEVKFLVGDPQELWKHVGKVDSYTIEETLAWMLHFADN